MYLYKNKIKVKCFVPTSIHNYLFDLKLFDPSKAKDDNEKKELTAKLKDKATDTFDRLTKRLESRDRSYKQKINNGS